MVTIGSGLASAEGQSLPLQHSHTTMWACNLDYWIGWIVWIGANAVHMRPYTIMT